MPTRSKGADRLQLLASLGLVGGFYAIMLSANPDDILVFGSSTLTFVLAYYLGRHLGEGPSRSREPVVVMLGAAAGVVMPASLSPPIDDLQWAALGCGLLAAQALWALNRYPPQAIQWATLWPMTAVFGCLWGLVTGAAFSVLGTAIIAIGLLTDSATAHVALGMWWRLIAGYLVGFAAAGFVAGLLLPLARWPLGTMLLGILGGLAVYGAVSPSVEFTDRAEGKPASSLSEQLGIALACAFAVGPTAALSIRYQAQGPSAT